MPLLPGLLTMPTVLLNAALSPLGRRGQVVRGPDTIAVVSPMYNESRGAARALDSIFAQVLAPDQLVVSINGCDDDTREVVGEVLRRRGYLPEPCGRLPGSDAELERWRGGQGDLEIAVAVFPNRTAKSDSLNRLVAALVRCDRVLVIDGDTVLASTFLATIRDNFYRLERRGDDLVLDDSALQSGAVMSFAPRGSGPAQRFISRGRRAEYAFAGVIRRGQTATFGSGPLFGRTRLFTVVGCGFVARRELFPIPHDTRTEDHDFTLAVQSLAPETTRLAGETLAARGFRVVQGDREVPLDAEVGFARSIQVRRSGDARFVGEALMLTEDPPHMRGFFHQVERWNGGAVENVLKRLGREPGRGMGPNVRFVLWTSLFEHLFGLLLLLLLPVLVALNVGSPRLGLPGSALVAWFGLDLLFGAALTGYGFWLYHRAARRRRPVAGLRAVAEVLTTLLPFMLLKYLNPLAFLAGAAQVWAQRMRRRAADPSGGVVWDRPAAPHLHTPRLARRLAVVLAILVLSAAQMSSRLDPVNREAWVLLRAEPRVEMANFERPPPIPRPPMPEPPAVAGLSHFCAPTHVSASAPTSRRLAAGAEHYEPLSPWGLLMLARLAPLAPYLEEAATAYDVPPRLFLQVLLNESYLDPLAVGPTGDKGLSQMTSDALTLLRALSSEHGSPLYNPRLVPAEFHIFDPDFSICAGAAKLAWARRQTGGGDPAVAYALYIDPMRGAPRGEVDPRQVPAVKAMLQLEDLVVRLQAVYAAAEVPGRLRPAERELVAVSAGVAAGELDLRGAYSRTLELVISLQLDDVTHHRRVLDELFPLPVQGEVETASIR